MHSKILKQKFEQISNSTDDSCHMYSDEKNKDMFLVTLFQGIDFRLELLTQINNEILELLKERQL